MTPWMNWLQQQKMIIQSHLSNPVKMSCRKQSKRENQTELEDLLLKGSPTIILWLIPQSM